MVANQRKAASFFHRRDVSDTCSSHDVAVLDVDGNPTKDERRRRNPQGIGVDDAGLIGRGR